MDIIEHENVRLHRWQCGPSTFVARPELGARLMSWVLTDRDGPDRPVIYWPEDVGSDDFYRIRGGNPILFPFSGRSFHQGSKGYWPDAKGIVRAMPMHGFARGGAFSLIETNDSGFTAELQPTEDDHEAYPYAYRFQVRYVFGERSLQCMMTLENLDEQPLLWSAGHHFYFTLPWKEQTVRQDYSFNIPAKNAYTHAPDGSLAAVKPFSTHDSFGNPANNDRIFTGLDGACACVTLAGSDEEVRVRILPDTDTASSENAFVIWSETEDSPFYCVEPWMGPPNSAEHGKGLHSVKPGEQSCFAVEVSV